MFLIDDAVKQEALNFSTMMNVLGCSAQKLEPDFEKFSQTFDTTLPMTQSVCSKYSSFFDQDALKILDEYQYAHKAFSRLRSTDEIIRKGSADYPSLLAQTEEAPRFLYLRGRKSLLFEKRAVAVVGSRNASTKSKENTVRVVESLGRHGMTIVSGLAKGIDVTAHMTALQKGYNTIAVIGTHLNQYYPSENKSVQIEIENKGLVVSQFSPATKTQRWFFPLRNGVMSGLSLATIIMEAGETSGALRQADYALKQGRQILIPQTVVHNPDISWPRKYVKKGAEIVTTPKDIIEKLSQNTLLSHTPVEKYYQQNIGEIYGNVGGYYYVSSSRIFTDNVYRR